MIRGKKPVPGSKQALELLNQHQIPWICLTNGGGHSEHAKAAEVSSILGIHLHPSQIVQAHTPFKALANKYKRVLIVGGEEDNCRHVAETEYGFKGVVVPSDLVKTNPAISPYKGFDDELIHTIGKVGKYYDPDSEESQIDAILVFNDSRDLMTDMQVTLDMLLSDKGKIGTVRDLRDTTQNFDIPSVPIYFCCNDYLWSNDYPLPRLGQGAIRVMLEKVYSDLTHGGKLESTIIGKPFQPTYEYAENVLREWKIVKTGGDGVSVEDIGSADANDEVNEEKKKKKSNDLNVFMVGDNPASDILGANNYGWYSILVRSGLFKDSDLPNIAAQPKQILNNALEAVEFGLRHSNIVKD